MSDEGKLADERDALVDNAESAVDDLVQDMEAAAGDEAKAEKALTTCRETIKRLAEKFCTAAEEEIEEAASKATEEEVQELVDAQVERYLEVLRRFGVDGHDLDVLDRHAPDDQFRKLLGEREVRSKILALAERVLTEMGL